MLVLQNISFIIKHSNSISPFSAIPNCLGAANLLRVCVCKVRCRIIVHQQCNFKKQIFINRFLTVHINISICFSFSWTQLHVSGIDYLCFSCGLAGDISKGLHLVNLGAYGTQKKIKLKNMTCWSMLYLAFNDNINHDINFAFMNIIPDFNRPLDVSQYIFLYS